MNNEFKKGWKRGSRVQLEILTRHPPTGTEVNHEICQHSRCPSLDSNRAPLEYKARAFLLHHNQHGTVVNLHAFNKEANKLKIMKVLSTLGHTVEEFVEALCYKPEGRGFESRWGEFLSVCLIVRASLWPWGRLPGDKSRPARKADLTAICKPIV
jgi:hypothetical protein